MILPNRHDNTPEYRYGFNGMEKDDELKGEGNSYDFGARMLDPRIGRWFAVDPMRNKSPGLTPYRFGLNNPIQYKDPDGMWEEDGHFWTVLAYGVSMGLDLNTAFELAQAAEAFDHKVHDDYSMQLTPMRNNNHAFALGIGTWADPDFQGKGHGLTGGTQEEVLRNAYTSIYLGDINYLHTIGDAWAHSFVDDTGNRVMFGEISFFGFTIQHAFMDENGIPRMPWNDTTDSIAHRQEEYFGYLNSLKIYFESPEFKYAEQIKNSADMNFFKFMQEKGGNKENNIMLLSSYAQLNAGAKRVSFITDYGGNSTYSNEEGKKNRNNMDLFIQYLEQSGVKYTITKSSNRTINAYGRNYSFRTETIETITID